jgi:ankyrin repeat protein
MNKKIIFSLCILIPTLSYGMKLNKNDQLVQTTDDRYNLAGIDKQKNFYRAEKLLNKKKANPDYRRSPEDPTSLMIAIYHNDKDYAHLFLAYGSNPHQKALYPGRTHEGPISALDMEQTGWLKKMIDDLTPQPQKKRTYNY